jgi:prephenate dehydrogenase
MVVGTGLIGGSIALGLRQRGWHVTGTDADEARQATALEIGALDEVGEDHEAEIVFVATPAAAVEQVARKWLERTGPSSVVTDVAGVKTSVVHAVDHPRFVGGHPMAGSEQVGTEGADGALFVGATWVLTPTASTDPAAFERVRAVVAELGAEVLALAPGQHDALVAVVSHVPHLVAAGLMALAERVAERHGALMRMAAGGFRDMTRVAAGDPAIWPDICAENAPAIVATLDALLSDLAMLRDRVAEGNRRAISELLERAARARRALPSPLAKPEELAELRVPVPDRPGVLAEITTLAGSRGVNIIDLEIAHSAEGDRGVVVMVVDGSLAGGLAEALAARGFRSTVRGLPSGA